VRDCESLTNPRRPSSVCSEPVGPQLDAEAIDGIANAHNAIAASEEQNALLRELLHVKCSS